jgi:cbb3-type cytochrome oxidase subunit 3
MSAVSLFGVNFFALNPGGKGRPASMLSGLSSAYLVLAVPSALLTVGIWMWWMRRGTRRRRNEDPKSWILLAIGTVSLRFDESFTAMGYLYVAF